MSNKRREFLKLSGLAGLGVVGTGFKGLSLEEQNNVLAQSKRSHTQRFNMSGYAAPKLDVVRVGIVGSRGPGAVNRLSKIEGVEIKALCDLLPEMVNKVVKSLEGTSHKPDTYSGSSYAWKTMMDRDDLDMIYIATPWEWHTPMAVYAM